MPRFLKTYLPSNTDETLRGKDFKDVLNENSVYIYLNGKYYVLECVACAEKTFLIAGKEIEEGDL